MDDLFKKNYFRYALHATTHYFAMTIDEFEPKGLKVNGSMV